MLPFLPGLGIRGIAIIALCVVLAGMAGTIYWLDAKRAEQQQVIGRLGTERDHAIATANANAAALAEAQRLQRHWEAIAGNLNAKRAATAATVKTITREIYRDAPRPEASCPDLSPVLHYGLERLRQLRAASRAARGEGAEDTPPR